MQQELEECCEEFDMKANGVTFITNAVGLVKSMNDGDCDAIGDMLEHLLNRNIITTEQIEKALVVWMFGK